jgi:hypothetical protein
MGGRSNLWCLSWAGAGEWDISVETGRRLIVVHGLSWWMLTDRLRVRTWPAFLSGW